MIDKGITFDDIVLVPQYSEIRSRKDVDTSFLFCKTGTEISVPIISANMKSVTGTRMAKTMWTNGGIGALHRFMTIEENISSYNEVISSGADCFVSIGIKEEDKDRFQALYAQGARKFIIDIAHGHCIMMKEMLEWIGEQYNKDDLYIMAGNVSTSKAARDLVKWGADAIKIGIGSGSVCTTRIVTGHGVPQVTAIDDIVKSLSLDVENVDIVADGGIKSSGDIVKAMALGANMVMIGGMFAGCDESNAIMIGGKKIYQGSAFKPQYNGTASEGVSTGVESIGALKFIMHELAGGIRSGMSYSNSQNANELRERALIAYQTSSGTKEGTPHMIMR